MESSAGTLLFHPILIGVQTGGGVFVKSLLLSLVSVLVVSVVGEVMSGEASLLSSLLSVASVMWVSVSVLVLSWCLLSLRGLAIHLREVLLHGLVFQGSTSCSESYETPVVVVGWTGIVMPLVLELAAA